MRTVFPGLMVYLVISLLTTGCGGGGGSNAQDSSPVGAPVTPPEPEPPGTTYSLSGTLTVSANQAVDSDTNDPTRPATSNNTTAEAQPISNPVTLGGYINQPGTGAPGRSQQSGDIDDYFRVELLAGQQVTMLVGDFAEADADLFLYDMQGNILDASADIGEIESLTITADGTYIINAFAFSGATNYILAIGAPNLATRYKATQHKIIPWQAVVMYKDDSTGNGTAGSSEDITRGLGLEQRAGGQGRGRLMAMRQGLIKAQHRDPSMIAAAKKSAKMSDPQLLARWGTMLAIKSLRKDPRVRYAEPNYEVSTLATPNDDAYPLQWHYPLIGLPDAWETTTGDPTVVVAVVDTGILSGHPDLAGKLVNGYDFVRDPQSAQDGDGIDANPEDPANGFGGSSQSFHGTHVSGTVAARGNNRVGVAGSAFGSRVMPIRALGAGGTGTSYDVDQAVRFAAGLPNDSGIRPQSRADIINLSLGGAPFSQASQDLYNQVRAAGVMVVAAAGNQASTAPTYPAAYQGVISVSAVDVQRRLTTYTNTGSTIDVAAPGGDNSVDINGDGYPDGVLSTSGSISGSSLSFAYTFLNGTSMAAPHVAGVLALMKSVNPQLTPADIDALLSSGRLSDDLGPPGRDDQFGHGIINAQLSVLAAIESTGTSPADNPRLSASASTLNFANSTTELELVLRNGGKGDLELIDVSASQTWVGITPLTVDSNSLGTYRISVDRTDLPAGIYTADITAQSSVNNLVVRLLITVGSLDAGSDVGVIYIVLYDPVLNVPVAQRVSGETGTGYQFQFDDIPAGEYELVAGSDADNDLLICDAGEACGALLTIDQPILLRADEDLTDLDFPVEFQVSLPTIINSNSASNDVHVTRQRALKDDSGGEPKSPIRTLY